MSARSRTPPYQRLQHEENNYETSSKGHHLKPRQSKAELLSIKLHALLWIIAAGVLIYFLDFFNVAFNDERVHRTYFKIALVGIGINICITLYLAIWLPYVQKITLEWSVYCPRMIPTATAVGVITTLCLVIALWPIWGLFTPGILFVLFVALLMTAHFLPAI